MSGKIIRSLQQKKYRTETKKFLVEGGKSVVELLGSDYKIENIYATTEFRERHRDLIAKNNVRVQTVEAAELAAFGTLEHNAEALAIAAQKEPIKPACNTGVTLALDDIRDPGNLGALIRIADWYGIKDIICSETCVDWHNPKVIAASMGSFTRVNGYYGDLAQLLRSVKAPKLGAFLDGKSTHEYAFPKNGILVIGSESHGIQKDVAREITERITIPAFGKAESLNAAIAGAVILDRWAGSLTSK